MRSLPAVVGRGPQPKDRDNADGETRGTASAVCAVAAAPTDVSEVDRAGAELEPTHISSFSLIGLSLIARLAMVAVAAVLLWSAVFWALA